MNLRTMLEKAIESEWALACRPNQRNAEILKAGRQSFSLLNNTLRYWCADPFVVDDGVKTYLFFEAFDRIKRKGVIGYREIDRNQIGKIHIIIEEPFHLSYPCIYEEGGNWYMVPESKDANKIIRYRAREFPRVWVKENILVDEIIAVDPTVFHHSSTDLKLFAYLWQSFDKGRLQVIHVREGTKSPEAQGAGDPDRIELDDPYGRKRPAGNLCLFDNALYRPSQLCSRKYGEGILFNRIACLTDSSYEETEYKRLTVDEIRLDQNVRITGVHTYNHSKNWEVIDVEISGISLIRIIGLLPRLYWFVKRRTMPHGSKAGI